jgi:hypothetical protein
LADSEDLEDLEDLADAVERAPIVAANGKCRKKSQAKRTMKRTMIQRRMIHSKDRDSSNAKINFGGGGDSATGIATFRTNRRTTVTLAASNLKIHNPNLLHPMLRNIAISTFVVIVIVIVIAIILNSAVLKSSINNSKAAHILNRIDRAALQPKPMSFIKNLIADECILILISTDAILIKCLNAIR